MDQQNDKISNRYNLHTSLAIDLYNAKSVHTIKIDINDKIFYQQQFSVDEKYSLKIEDYFDYSKPGLNNLTITWNGEHDCEHKYMKIRKVVINQQHLAPFKVMTDPIENDYIRDLKTTEQGLVAYKKQLFNPGYRHGWYGTYKFRFAIDPSSMPDRSQQALVSASGIQCERILTDLNRAKHLNRANNS
jgi:hypothetical protein